MAICFKCKKKIDGLERTCSGIEKSWFFIDKDEKYGTTSDDEFDSDGTYEEYRCPECDEILFYDWGKAEKFLLEKDELKELVVDKINGTKT